MVIDRQFIEHPDPHPGLHHALADGPVVWEAERSISQLEFEDLRQPGVEERGLQPELAVLGREAADRGVGAVSQEAAEASVGQLQALTSGAVQ